jgi:predicted ATPase
MKIILFILVATTSTIAKVYAQATTTPYSMGRLVTIDTIQMEDKQNKERVINVDATQNLVEQIAVLKQIIKLQQENINLLLIKNEEYLKQNEKSNIDRAIELIDIELRKIDRDKK